MHSDSHSSPLVHASSSIPTLSLFTNPFIIHISHTFTLHPSPSFLTHTLITNCPSPTFPSWLYSPSTPISLTFLLLILPHSLPHHQSSLPLPVTLSVPFQTFPYLSLLHSPLCLLPITTIHPFTPSLLTHYSIHSLPHVIFPIHSSLTLSPFPDTHTTPS